jgi:hypothetical protein
MIGSRQEAQRLSKLAQERYGTYGIHGVCVVLTFDGYRLIAGDLSQTYRSAAACEQMILEFGSAPLLSKAERAPS